MSSEEFKIKAKELGIKDKDINDIIADVENSELPLDYNDYLIKPAISD